MAHPATIGLDIAKDVFQVHGIDDAGIVVARRKLRRPDLLNYFKSVEPCLVGIEACANAHHWARSLAALGHQVKLMPPSYVKPYVKTQKNDAADAEAICEAVTRPTMRFVPVKSEEQQAVLVLHQARSLLIDQRTMLINALRGHLAEYGIVARVGTQGAAELAKLVRGGSDPSIPAMARDAMRAFEIQIETANESISAYEKKIRAWHSASPQSRRLISIPGIGILTATALVAKVPDPSAFRSGRQFAAWIGLVPRQFSTGGKVITGRISKRGDRYLRRLLVIGARNVLIGAKAGRITLSVHLEQLVARKPFMVACVALANKNARIAWALLSRKEAYNPLRARLMPKPDLCHSNIEAVY